MKKNKVEGLDGITAEFWKSLGKRVTRELVELCQQMYRQGVWPEEFTKTVMIPLPKKVNATECSDYRTISLIPHASKILLKILTQRIAGKAKEYISKTQFGFRKGLGTREAIGVMRMMSERSLEHDNKIYVCFVDFEKAFDRVNWVQMMKVLKSIGVDWRDRRMVMNLYMNQEAVVRVNEEYTAPGLIGRGVRQGCLLSPLLFTLYAEAMMGEAMEGIEEGVRIGGESVTDVRFADDQGMVASSEKGLQRVMDGLNNAAKRYGMIINVKKTKVMKISKKGRGRVNILINGEKVEQVDKFKYLGAWITEDGRCETEIKTRIGMAKGAFSKKKELLTKGLSRTVKKKIVLAVLSLVALYGAETWALWKEDVRRLDAFEMWVWRKIEKTPGQSTEQMKTYSRW
jgi:hypothetical protein